MAEPNPKRRKDGGFIHRDAQSHSSFRQDRLRDPGHRIRENEFPLNAHYLVQESESFKNILGQK
jgi:hypothetical protein